MSIGFLAQATVLALKMPSYTESCEFANLLAMVVSDGEAPMAKWWYLDRTEVGFQAEVGGGVHLVWL